VILATVTVTAVNHDKSGKFSLLQLSGSLLDLVSLIVGTNLSTTKNNMAAIVTLSLYNSRETLLCDGKEMMAVAGSLDGIKSNANGTVSTILEANWA
jgi:hypothetical protein